MESLEQTVNEVSHRHSLIAEAISKIQEEIMLKKIDTLEIDIEEETKEVEEVDETEEVEEEPSLEEEIEETSISYETSEENFLAENFYKGSSIDYEELSYTGSNVISAAFNSDDEYWAAKAAQGEMETLTTEEAQQAIQEIQYAALMGTNHDVNCVTRRKFDLWVKFNSAEFQLFEKNTALTRDVDYKPFA